MEDLVANPAFWCDKTVLITGHSGFKGGWLTLWLQALGAKVIGFSLPVQTGPALFELAGLNETTDSEWGDIRDAATISRLIQQKQPDIVFHLAAQALVRHSYRNPVETYATNVMGTVNLLEALRHHASVRAAIIVTSDKCYDNREWLWGYREPDALGGRDPYSSSKGCAELVTAAYRASFFDQAHKAPAIATVRAGNVMGGGDFATDRIVPDFLRAVTAKQPLKVRYPNAIRPWQHVLEPLSGYIRLTEQLWQAGERFAGAWNFGPDEQDAQSVAVLANLLVNHWGENASWSPESQENKLHEAHHLKLDISKARTQLRWQPRWSLTKAVAATVAWYKAYCGQANLSQLMLQQIAEYEQSKNSRS